jgi:hypothetical protein
VVYNLVENDVIKRFKELIKQGFSVSKAKKESGLSHRKYRQHYEEIWNDPEMAPLKPKPLFQKAESTEPEEPDQSKEEKAKDEGKLRPPETPALDEALKGIETEKPPSITPTEAINALKWYQREFNKVFGRGMPVAIGVRQPKEQGAPPEAAVAGYGVEGSLKQVKVAEEEAKKLLEKLGYKVVTTETPVTLEEAKKLVEDMGYQLVDTRLAREEVEKMLEEAERKWQEEHDLNLETRLEEAKIGAAERVVTRAIDKVMEPFTYFLKKWFEETIETRVTSSSQTSERTEAPPINPETHRNRETAVQALPLTRYTRERPSESEEKEKEES